MRYKPKSIAALQLALGGLPAQMRVEVELGIEVRAKTVGRSSQSNDLAGKFGPNGVGGPCDEKS